MKLTCLWRTKGQDKTITTTTIKITAIATTTNILIAHSNTTTAVSRGLGKIIRILIITGQPIAITGEILQLTTINAIVKTGVITMATIKTTEIETGNRETMTIVHGNRAIIAIVHHCGHKIIADRQITIWETILIGEISRQ